MGSHELETISYLSLCPVYVELDTLEDAAVALGGREALAVLGYFEVTVGGIVKAVFWLACFDIRF